MSPLEILSGQHLHSAAVAYCLMLAGHAAGDFPLQGEYLSKMKNPGSGPDWRLHMRAHCAIHGAIVGLVTGSLALGLLEYWIHFRTDVRKCEGRISYRRDQEIHLACKLAWALACVALLPIRY